MVKIYWNLNKRIYSWMFILSIIIAIALIILKVVADKVGIDMMNQNMTNQIEIGNQVFDNLMPVFLYGLVVGILGLLSSGIHIYIMVKPFMVGQLQQVLLLGKRIEPYILVHYAFSVIVGLVGSISSLFLVENEISSIVKLTVSSFAYPAWIIAGFLLLYNDNFLPQMVKKRRITLIIGGLLICWFGIAMMQVFPAMIWGMQLAMSVAAAEGTATANNIMEQMPSTVNSLANGIYGIQIVDIMGLIIFIISFRWVKDKYTIQL